MKYKDFKNRLRNHPYFTSAIYGDLTRATKVLHNQVNQWAKNGDIIKLRRGLYTLCDGDRKVGLSKRLLANVLYSPSYISLEYALSYYDMIPEAVFAVTSVSTRKTKEFTNEFGHFIYKSVKRCAFTDFISIKDEFGFTCLMATPEKALIDYLYFNVSSTTKVDEGFFENSMRLQNEEQLDAQSIAEISERFNSKKIMNFVKPLLEWLEKNES